MDLSTIELESRLAERLVRLARESNRSLGDVVRDAVDEYLMRHELDDEAWRAQLTEVVERLRAGVPGGEPPTAIEREITLAREEARAGRAASGR
jgi:predicted transcriptional regulator